MLFSAIIYPRFEMLDYLLSQPGCHINIQDSNIKFPQYYNDTPLLRALRINKPHLLHYLLGKKGINLNLSNDKGETPIFLAVIYNDVTAFKMLVEHGIDIDHKIHYNGQNLSARELAIIQERTAIIEYMETLHLQHRANSSLSTTTSNTQTPTDAARPESQSKSTVTPASSVRRPLPPPPVASRTTKPAATQTTIPAAPRITKPAATQTTNPAAPRMVKPAAAQTTIPVALRVTTPATTQTTTPAALSTRAPVATSITPVAAVPVAPRVTSPATTQTTTPAALFTRTPVATSITPVAAAPVAFSTSMTVTPVVAAPVDVAPVDAKKSSGFLKLFKRHPKNDETTNSTKESKNKPRKK